MLPSTEQLLETGGDLAPDALGTDGNTDGNTGSTSDCAPNPCARRTDGNTDPTPAPSPVPDASDTPVATGASADDTSPVATGASADDTSSPRAGDHSSVTTTAGAAAKKTVVRFLADFPGFDKIGVERAVKLAFSLDKRKATERMRRVMHALKAGTKSSTETGGPTSRATTGLMIDIDPLLVMVKSDDGVSCVVIMPSPFKSADGSRVSELPLGALKDSATLVTGRVLLVKSAEADLITNDETLTFNSTSIGEEIVTPGPFAQPFSPDCAGDDDGFPVWRVSVKDTACALDVAWGALAAGSTLRARMAKLTSGRSVYKGMDRTPAFIATGTESRALALVIGPCGAAAAPAGVANGDM